MISPEQNKLAMENLIAKANATTGKNDTDLSSGVNSLIEGYGTGDIEAYDGSVTVDDGATVVFDEDYAEGIEQGKKAERKLNWDIILGNGERKSFERAFSFGYSFDNFYPNHDIRPKSSIAYGFIGWNDGDGNSPNHEGSLIERLNECGVVLDISKATSVASMFAYTRFTELPLLDFSSINNTASTNKQVFYDSIKLRKIEKIIVHENLHYSQWFSRAYALTDIVIEGIIGNDIDFKDCPLSKASTTSVMTALSSTATGKTATFNKSAVDTAFETSEGLADGSTSAEWATLVETKSNWTVSLV